MHRIDGPGATATNTYTAGDVAQGIPATEVTAEAMNALQEEIAGAIEGMGGALNKADNGQLLSMIQSLSGVRKGAILVALSVDTAMTQQAYIVQDVKFDTIISQTGTLATAALDATGGVIMPAGVGRILAISRVVYSGMAAGAALGTHSAIQANHAGTPTEAGVSTSTGNATSTGTVSVMLPGTAGFNVVAGDVIDSVVAFTSALAPNVAGVNPSGDYRTWMYIEEVN